MAAQRSFPMAPAPDADQLPDYADSQRQTLKAARDEWYRAYSENVRLAETDYTGSTGNLRIPPNNMVSGIVKAAFAIKHKVSKKKGKDKQPVQEITVEESTMPDKTRPEVEAAPDYER